MKIARYKLGNAVHWGVLAADGKSIERLAHAPFASIVRTGTLDKLSDAKLLAPAEEGTRVWGVGLNYVLHAKEAGMELPVIPMLFMKPDLALCGPDDPIVYPRGSERVDYECELAVVIGRTCRKVSEADALSYVLGYTCANDVSERTIQRAEMKMGALLVGKGFDGFCPLGPVIATGLDPTRLQVSTRVNGATKQSSNTADMIFSVAKLISYMSQAMTLKPGDVIITGTPSGIGPVKPGDVVEIEVEGVGVLRNPVVAEGA